MPDFLSSLNVDDLNAIGTEATPGEREQLEADPLQEAKPRIDLERANAFEVKWAVEQELADNAIVSRFGIAIPCPLGPKQVAAWKMRFYRMRKEWRMLTGYYNDHYDKLTFISEDTRLVIRKQDKPLFVLLEEDDPAVPKE